MKPTVIRLTPKDESRVKRLKELRYRPPLPPPLPPPAASPILGGRVVGGAPPCLYLRCVFVQ